MRLNESDCVKNCDSFVLKNSSEMASVPIFAITIETPIHSTRNRIDQAIAVVQLVACVNVPSFLLAKKVRCDSFRKKVRCDSFRKKVQMRFFSKKSQMRFFSKKSQMLFFSKKSSDAILFEKKSDAFLFKKKSDAFLFEKKFRCDSFPSRMFRLALKYHPCNEK